MTKICIITDVRNTNLLAWVDLHPVHVKTQRCHVYDVIIEYDFQSEEDVKKYVNMLKQFKCVVKIKVK